VIDPALRRLAVPIDSVTPHPRNDHHQGDVGAIALSLRRFGQVRPIVVQKSTSFIVAGNHVHAAMKAEGEKKIAAVVVDLADEDALAYLIADNRTAELAYNDPESHAAILTELREAGLLEGTGYDDEDVGHLLADLARDAEGAAGGEPDPIDPPKDPVSKPGEVYELGLHRLICGDAADPAVLLDLMAGDLAAAMWTDPHYGIDYQVGLSPEEAKKLRRRTDGLVVAGDDDEVPELLQRTFSSVDPVLEPGAAFYVAHPAGPQMLAFAAAIAAAGWEWRQSLVWKKDAMVLGRADYHGMHEPILYGFKPASGLGRLGRGGRRWYGDNSQTTVAEVERPRRSDEHPTMKPVDLVVGHLRNSAPPGAIVLDPFGGSGTTLLAAERLGMAARLVEIDPRYCDVIRARYEAAALNVQTTVSASG
jgi:DNA modification methylase